MLGANLLVLLIRGCSVYLLVAHFSRLILLLFSSSPVLAPRNRPYDWPHAPRPRCVGCELQLVERGGGQAKGDLRASHAQGNKIRCIAGPGLRVSLSPLSSQAPLRPEGLMPQF